MCVTTAKAEPVLLFKLTRFVDAFGESHWVQMSGDVETLLDATDPPLKERLLKPETWDKIAVRRRGNPWDGPRYDFTWFLGEGRTWPGPAPGDMDWEPSRRRKGRRARPPCEFCRGLWLPSGGYCLRCDRTGRDNCIRPPSKTEIQRITMPEEDDGLKGGKGK